MIAVFCAVASIARERSNDIPTTRPAIALGAFSDSSDWGPGLVTSSMPQPERATIEAASSAWRVNRIDSMSVISARYQLTRSESENDRN